MRPRALIAWIDPRSVYDLRRFFRSAARWSGADAQIDGGLHALSHDLSGATRGDVPLAFRATSTAWARTDCRVVWDRLVTLGYITRDGLVTEFGQLVVGRLARAARLDGGLGYGFDGVPLIEAEEGPMPTAEEIRENVGDVLTLRPMSGATPHRPNPIEGWEALDA